MEDQKPVYLISNFHENSKVVRTLKDRQKKYFGCPKAVVDYKTTWVVQTKQIFTVLYMDLTESLINGNIEFFSVFQTVLWLMLTSATAKYKILR